MLPLYKIKSATIERSGLNFYFDERKTIPGYGSGWQTHRGGFKGKLKY